MGANAAEGERGGERSKADGRRVRRKTERRETVTGERNVRIAILHNVDFQKEIF